MSSIDEAFSFRQTPNDETLSFTPTDPPIHRRFLIGGTQIYRQVLSQPLVQTSYTIDRILMTRIHHPEFPQCDVFMPEFRSPEQMAEDAGRTGHSQSGHGDLDGAIFSNSRSEGNWRRCTTAELRVWAGFEIPEGIQEENGVSYEFQMWERIGLGCE